jgi:hypothetical protein
MLADSEMPRRSVPSSRQHHGLLLVVGHLDSPLS